MGLKDTKIRLSADELAFLSETAFFDKKRNIIDGIIDLFGDLEGSIHEKVTKFSSVLPEATLNKRGKISRGENYQGLPYVILDYPSVFTKEGIFAFRTLMWWGNPFTFTFHISGSYLHTFRKKLIDCFSRNDNAELLVCINGNQFEHHLGVTNYRNLNEFLANNGNISELIKTNGFLKITQALPLIQIDKLNSGGVQFVEDILTRLN